MISRYDSLFLSPESNFNQRFRIRRLIMHLKHKLFYISIGIILLAALQVGFHLITKPAFADNHQVSETANKPQPVKILNFIDYPLGGKSAYLEWVKEIGPSLVTEEVARIRSYDNFEGSNPHRLVEMETWGIEDMQKYQRRSEVRALMADMSNHTSRSEVHTFIQRSDYTN